MHNTHQRLGPLSVLSVMLFMLDQPYQKQSNTNAQPIGIQLCLQPQSELLNSCKMLLSELSQICRHGGIPSRVPGAPSPLCLINDV